MLIALGVSFGLLVFQDIAHTVNLKQGCLFHISKDGEVTYGPDEPQTEVNHPKVKNTETDQKQAEKPKPDLTLATQFIELNQAEAEAKESLDKVHKEYSQLLRISPISEGTRRIIEQKRLLLEELRLKWQNARAALDAYNKKISDEVRAQDLHDARVAPNPYRPTAPPRPPAQRNRREWKPWIERSQPPERD